MYIYIKNIYLYKKFIKANPESDFWQISSCSSRFGRSEPRILSFMQHLTTLGSS